MPVTNCAPPLAQHSFPDRFEGTLRKLEGGLPVRALITRPQEDAGPLAEALEQRGVSLVIEPLLEIIPRQDAIDAFDLHGVTAVLITSSNGARMLARATERRDIRLFAVGDSSARTARDLGFSQVDSAGGDVGALAQLVYAALPATGATLVHVAGKDVAGDLSGLLEKAGFTVRRAVLYDAHAPASLSATTIAALRAGAIDAVLLFSPRTAAAFVDLARRAGVEKNLAGVTVYGLSEAVAEAAREAGATGWAAVRVAAHPDTASLLSLIDADLADNGVVTDNGPPTANHREGAIVPQSGEDISDMDDQKPTPQKSTLRRVGRWLLGLFLIFLVLAGLGAYAAWPRLSPYVEPYLEGWRMTTPSVDRIGPLEARLEALEAAAARRGDVDALDQKLTAADVQRGDDRARFEARLATLEGALAGLETELAALRARRPEDGASVAVVQALTERIAAQETARVALGGQLAELEKTENRKTARRGEALLLAIGQLRDGINGGAPYGPELTAVQALLADDDPLGASLARLEAGSAQGVPTLEDLRRRFDGMARRVLRAMPPDSGDWLARLRHRLGALVTVRPSVGTIDTLAADAPTSDLLSVAETRLAAGDLAGALAVLDRLSGLQAAQAAAWIGDGRARIAADEVQKALAAAAIARLSEAPASGTEAGK